MSIPAQSAPPPAQPPVSLRPGLPPARSARFFVPPAVRSAWAASEQLLAAAESVAADAPFPRPAAAPVAQSAPPAEPAAARPASPLGAAQAGEEAAAHGRAETSPEAQA